MSHHAMDIYQCNCKGRTLNLLLVPSYVRFREGLPVLPGMRIRIVKEYAQHIGAEKDAFGMLLCTQHIVGISNRPHAPK